MQFALSHFKRKNTMKKWQQLSLSMFLAGSCLFYLGCESNSDNTQVDEYLQNQSVQSVGRDTESPLELELEPQVATLTLVGQEVLFKAGGGSLPYKWSVANSSKGQIASKGDVHALYSCLIVGENTVRVEDRKGLFAIARITSLEDEMTIEPAEVELVESWEAAFSVNGGSPPYVWTVGNSALGTISYSSTATYQAAYHGVVGKYGVNIVTARDAEGRTASAKVEQKEKED